MHLMPNPVQCWLSNAFPVKCNRVLFYVQLYFLAPSHLSCRTWQRAEVRNGSFLVNQCLISYWNNLISEKDDDFNTMVSAELGIEFLRTFDCGARKKKGEKGSWDPPGPEAAMCSTSLLHSRVEWVRKEKKKNVCNNLNLKVNFDLIEFSSPSVFDFCICLYIQALQAWGLAEWILRRDAHVLTGHEFWIVYFLVKFTLWSFVT